MSTATSSRVSPHSFLVFRNSAIVTFLPIIALAAFFAYMLWWTWGKWPDLLIDFGRELYVPWRLSQGQVLYRDVEAFYGPLSQYLNALAMKAFGAQWRTLVWMNLCIAIAFAIVLFHVVRNVANRFAALACCGIFIAMFCFGQQRGMGNFNFMCPYAHEATHGIVLAFAAMAMVQRYAVSLRVSDAGLCGLLLGLVFLTKIEPFLAVAPASVVGVCAALWARRAPAHRWSHIALAFCGAAMIPVVIAFALLWMAMPAGDALRGTLGSWPHAFNPALQTLPFFKLGMGANDLAGNLGAMFIVGAWQLLVFGLAFVASMMLRRRRRVAIALIAIIACASLFAIAFTLNAGFWRDQARSLPVWLTGLAVVVCINLTRSRRDHEIDQSAAPTSARLALIIFAGLMLLKMGLAPRWSHYGFVLALPATVVIIAALLCWIPRAIARHGGQAIVFQTVALTAIAGVAAHALDTTAAHHRVKSYKINIAEDAIFADAQRGTLMQNAIQWLRQNAKPVDTLAVFPEGAILNFATRVPAPSPFVTYLPTDMIMFGEERMLDALRGDPPDFVAVIVRNASEFGARSFGEDYARQLFAFIIDEYELAYDDGELIRMYRIKR